MTKPLKSFNTAAIYEIIVNLIQGYDGKSTKPTYRLMERVYPNCKVHDGDCRQLLSLILYRLPQNVYSWDDDGHYVRDYSLIELITADMSYLPELSRREYRRQANELERKCIVKRIHPNNRKFIVNPEYVRTLTTNDMDTINRLIVDPTIKRMIIRSSDALASKFRD